MKIGFIIYGELTTVSGGYYYDRRLIAALRSRGDVVDVVSLRRRPYLLQLTDNLHIRLPTATHPESRRPPGDRIEASDGRFDILIQDELTHPSLIVANRRNRFCPRAGLVHHLRSSEPSIKPAAALYRLVERMYLQGLDGRICSSVTTRKAVEALDARGAPAVVASPPCDRFGEPISEHAILNRAARPGPLRLVFLGNVIRRKGLHTLLDALALCPEGSWSLDVVGSVRAEAGYARRMQRRAARLSRSPSVVFHGKLEEAAVAKILSAAHVLALPSQYEGYGIAYLEGMCFGLPALATRSGAAAEIIEDGAEGWLIDPGSATQLAGRLRELIADRASLARLGVAARRRYLREPAWDQTVASIRQFLLGLCGPR